MRVHSQEWHRSHRLVDGGACDDQMRNVMFLRTSNRSLGLRGHWQLQQREFIPTQCCRGRHHRTPGGHQRGGERAWLCLTCQARCEWPRAAGRAPQTRCYRRWLRRLLVKPSGVRVQPQRQRQPLLHLPHSILQLAQLLRSTHTTRGAARWRGEWTRWVHRGASNATSRRR